MSFIRQTLIIIIIILVLPKSLRAEEEGKNLRAVRSFTTPIIDGLLTEACWQTAYPAEDFIQYMPNFDQPSRFRTQVWILYTDNALYIGAKLYDPHPDSILRQMGNRDQDDLNADYFAVGLDTYKNQQDAYVFKVYASGVQCDERFLDETYDAVWRSAVAIESDGWSVEMEIPYSSLRFPKQEVQLWGLQFERQIRRYRELSRWNPEPQGIQNRLAWWGILEGIRSVELPLRLSFNPYLSASLQHYPSKNASLSDWSWFYNGGADMKYGINQAFTLDMTLLPDFTQVKSDDKIKNLTAFETIYEEQRPFFREAMDLFDREKLFYSRRIGRTPSGFYQVASSLDSGEVLIDNPAQARLINALKVSGRSNRGLAIGLLNALTARMHAVIEDTLRGTTREVVTEPFANYNVLVVDQALKNGSSAWLMNISVIREDHYSRSNVSAGGFKLYTPRQKWGLELSSALSQNYNYDNISGFRGTLGSSLSFNTGKMSGKHQFTVSGKIVNKNYNANDLGITTQRDYFQKSFTYIYRIFNPVGRIRNLTFKAVANHQHRLSTQKTEQATLRLQLVTTSLKYTTFWASVQISPFFVYDFYEPRVAGRYYLLPRYGWLSFNYSSDYRKPLAVDGGVSFKSTEFDGSFISAVLSPRIRLSDRFFIVYKLSAEESHNDRGFLEVKDNDVVFVNRSIRGLENSLSVNYNFRNNLSLSVWGRHYSYAGDYDKYFTLMENGRLANLDKYEGSAGFYFSTFNLETAFQWEFSPGSLLSFVWKNEAFAEDDNRSLPFFDALSNTFTSSPQKTLSLRLVYYLDYLYLRKWLRPASTAS
ncbi:MAG: DUF5916 domain-containing protein [Bacteroidales bacterium]